MNLFLLLPILLGLAVITQGQINRQLSLMWGLPVAVFINACVFLVASLGFYFLSLKFSYLFADFLQIKQSPNKFSLIFLIPGLCGFFLVLGLPWSFQTLGTGPSFVLLVAAQIIGGLLWDMYSQQRPTPWSIWFGAFLILGGVSLVLLTPKN